MSNFSDFIEINRNKSDQSQKNINCNNSVKDNLQSQIDKYSSYSQDRLINEFIKLTIEKKKNGELSDDELDILKNTITPMLNIDQKKSLDKLLQMVKNVE